MRKLSMAIGLAAALFMGNGSCASKFSDGQFLYKQVCANCHMDDGSGLPGLIPPIALSDYLKDNQAQLPCIIKHGLKGPITVNGKQYGGQEMAGITVLTDVEITNIINYINTGFGNENRVVQLKEVQAALENCPK